MNLLISLNIFLSLFAAEAPDNTFHITIRNLYYRASVEERFISDMLKQLDRVDRNEPIWIGYRGMAYMLKAKHAWNPYNKVSHFQTGRDLLEKAIAQEPGNVELRFLRFSVQSNAPAFLGYGSDCETDLALIVEQWPRVRDEDLKKRIRHFVSGSEYSSPRIEMQLKNE